MAKLNKLLNNFQTLGLKGGLMKIFRDHVYSSRVDVEMRLRFADLPRMHTAEKNGMRFIHVNRLDDPDLAFLQKAFPRQSVPFPKNIEDGCTLVAIEKDGIVHAYFVTAPHDYYEWETYRLAIGLESDTAYCYNFVVPPEHRKSHAARIMLTEGLSYLERQGLTYGVAVVDGKDKILQRLYRNFKFSYTDRKLHSVRIFHVRFSRWVTEAKA